jgi:hypothetical protein
MRIAIPIRMYQDERYNARVYYERFKSCDWLSEPILDDSYTERVAYRLKKWCGVAQERLQFSGKSKGPHQERFCEGCKAGHCSEGRGMVGIVQEFSSFSCKEHTPFASTYQKQDHQIYYSTSAN